MTQLTKTVSDIPYGVFSFIPATDDDIPALVSLLLLSGDGLYECLLDDLNQGHVEIWLAWLLTNPTSAFHYTNWRICKLENDILGGMCLSPALLLGTGEPLAQLKGERLTLAKTFSCPQDTSYHLLALGVKEICQGQGIGSALLNWAIAEAKSQGYPSLSLFCRIDHELNLTFYKKHRFGIIRQTPEIDGLPIRSSYYLSRFL